MFNIAPQNPHTGRMKGADPDAFRSKAHQRIHSLTHLSRRLIRKGNSQDIPGIDLFFLDQVCNPVGQYPGLPRSGSRQNKERTFGVKHCLLLHGI